MGVPASPIPFRPPPPGPPYSTSGLWVVALGIAVLAAIGLSLGERPRRRPAEQIRRPDSAAPAAERPSAVGRWLAAGVVLTALAGVIARWVLDSLR